MLGSLFDFCSIYVPLFSLGFQKLLQEVIEGVGRGGSVGYGAREPGEAEVAGGGGVDPPHPPARGWWVGGRVVAPHAARGDTR